ncbi:hypothetical protein CK516_36730 [Nostoc sp. 'Peltigera malacea cyanobiont' DB3992]|nr:hypothetical protein CK516_36730 [Nostoc sp. 'Peltigera malacea cyanobiont' DB3992]
MKLDLVRFFQACNPSKALVVSKPEDRQYYIDFSKVRGAKIIEELGRTITRLSPEEPTCQLFTGHIGCGKSTELLRLKGELEQQGFHVIKQRRNELTLAITPDEWELLREVAQEKSLRGHERYELLLRSMFVFEYRDEDGSWFDINPILAEAKEFLILAPLHL